MLAARHAGTFKKAPRFIRAEVADVRIDGEKVMVAKPRTFMNESGQAVAPLVRYYSTPQEYFLVVPDDIDLPFGKLRLQRGRSAGGNNGVKSIIAAMGTQEFWRLKCGVGRPPGRKDPAAFVLKPFAKAEREEIDVTIQFAADVVEVFVREGGEAARQQAGELNS